jgi:glucosamine 6-phosphate synthetase-like amidotransferase/phosphosugar isomerase protein
MCGIYGNLNYAEFYRLYKLNQSRGSYSTGFLLTGESEYEIKKTSEEISYYPIAQKKYYLGHNRAPTTDDRGKGLAGCHPFIFGRAIAAHNGILSNTDKLEKIYNISFEIDSQWIPYLYHLFLTKNHLNLIPENAFLNVLKEIKGTYGIWLYDVKEECIFVARGDNTVYWDKNKTAFSSIANEVHEELMPEGAIYRKLLNEETFTDINEDRRLKRDQKYFII